MSLGSLFIQLSTRRLLSPPKIVFFYCPISTLTLYQYTMFCQPPYTQSPSFAYLCCLLVILLDVDSSSPPRSAFECNLILNLRASSSQEQASLWNFSQSSLNFSISSKRATIRSLPCTTFSSSTKAANLVTLGNLSLISSTEWIVITLW